MQTFRVVFINSTAQVIGKIVTAGSTLLVAALLARSFGQGGFGEFTLMTTYAAMFYMAADFGFNAIALRRAEGKDEKIKEEFQSLLGLRIVYSLVLIFLALAILSFFPYSVTLKLATIVMAVTIINHALYSTANLIFQYKLRYDLSVLSASVGSLLNLAIIYLLIQAGLGLIFIASAYVLAGLVMATIALNLVRTQIGSFQPEFDMRKWSGLIAATIPVGLTLVFNLIYFRADTFIISFFKGSEDVGIYGSAYKLFDFALVFPVFFMNALYPILIKNYEENRELFRRMVRWSILGLAGLGTVGALIGIFAAPWLLETIYGPDFTEAVLPFQILIASAPIFFLSSIYMWLMLILKRQKTMALVYAFGMVLNIALSIYFIPQYSYNGAALITGFSEALILLLTYYLSRDWKKDAETA